MSIYFAAGVIGGFIILLGLECLGRIGTPLTECVIVALVVAVAVLSAARRIDRALAKIERM